MPHTELIYIFNFHYISERSVTQAFFRTTTGIQPVVFNGQKALTHAVFRYDVDVALMNVNLQM
jgi:hypothetical protein